MCCCRFNSHSLKFSHFQKTSSWFIFNITYSREKRAPCWTKISHEWGLPPLISPTILEYFWILDTIFPAFYNSRKCIRRFKLLHFTFTLFMVIWGREGAAAPSEWLPAILRQAAGEWAVRGWAAGAGASPMPGSHACPPFSFSLSALHAHQTANMIIERNGRQWDAQS